MPRTEEHVTSATAHGFSTFTCPLVNMSFNRSISKYLDFCIAIYSDI